MRTKGGRVSSKKNLKQQLKEAEADLCRASFCNERATCVVSWWSSGEMRSFKMCAAHGPQYLEGAKFSNGTLRWL
jgi:hypothetical protein